MQNGPHTIAVMAAVTKETDKEDDFNAYRTNFISPALSQLFAGGTLGQQVGGQGYLIVPFKLFWKGSL